MEIVLWGTRGSIPSPAPSTQFYGANTACIEMRTQGGDLLIFDAGSGLRLLGDTLPETGECHLFITHGHTDHTIGLGFFKPFYSSKWSINIYLPSYQQKLIERFFDGNFFPLHYRDLRANITANVIEPGSEILIPSQAGEIRIETFEANHPGEDLAYKVHADGKTFLYTGDHEITNAPKVRASTKKMLEDADLALVDATFNKSDYMPGWGHSTWEDWLEASRGTGVKSLVLTHHRPERTDSELDALQAKLDGMHAPRVFVAREGMRFGMQGEAFPELYSSAWLQNFIDALSEFREEGVILDSILKKTREVTQADAGTVFLLEGDELVFSYTHNDSLFPVNESSKYAYANIRIPCSTDSIAGYVAVTRKSLNLADVRKLPDGAPYRFNDSFDKKTGYRTVSTLTIPLIGRNQRLMGVLQLINSLNPRDKRARSFTDDMEKTVRILSIEASKVLEVSDTVRDNIDRLLRMAAFHDPSETRPHAERVGAIAAELFQVWAVRHGMPVDKILHFRSQLRIAAMLHDVGKVGVSDLVLKKPGKLTPDEFEIIKTHTDMGGALFGAQMQDISLLAHDIALYHHEWWNGSGYGQDGAAPLVGEAIPLAARITAIADVFDALVSRRCYKKPWTFAEAFAEITRGSGTHFDPELVTAFLGMQDTIRQIYERFPETCRIDIKP